MPRALNLRQIEAFKAVIECGTVSRAAGLLNVSQPAVSKLLNHLEADSGLKLFDRRQGRLAATAQGMRLYQEVERIFAGVHQVNAAVESIRREERGRLTIGVLPALAGAFIQRATMGFLARHPDVYCAVQSMGSQWVAENVVTRKIDVGLVTGLVRSPLLVTEPLIEAPLLCAMPNGHRLARRTAIRPADLDGEPFIEFDAATYSGQRIAAHLAAIGARPNVVLTANVTQAIGHLVAAGLGIALMPALFLAGMEDAVTTRPLEPTTTLDFLLCHARDARNATLIADFVRQAKESARGGGN